MFGKNTERVFMCQKMLNWNASSKILLNRFKTCQIIDQNVSKCNQESYDELWLNTITLQAHVLFKSLLIACAILQEN